MKLWLMQAVSGAAVMKLHWVLSSWCHWSALPSPNFLGSVLNFIFKSAINHGAELEMSPSAIKAAEQSLLSPVSIVHHGLTSGIRKLPDVLTLPLLAPAGILTASSCTGQRLRKSSSPSPFTYIPPSSKSYYPTASVISAGFTLIDWILRPAKVAFLAAPIPWQGTSWQSPSIRRGQASPSAPVLHVVYNTLQEGIFSRY